jgi:hypothetical protein
MKNICFSTILSLIITIVSSISTPLCCEVPKKIKKQTIIKTEHSLGVLLKNFKEYETSNKSFHSGNVYQHAVWVSRAVINFWQNNAFWTNNVSLDDIKLVYFAALLHDVGKAGDFVTLFFDKPGHELDGFAYVAGLKTYWLDPETKFDFASMFKSLQLDLEDQKVISILIGVHGCFGHYLNNISTTNWLKNLYSPKSQLYTQFINEIKKFALMVNYGDVDERLLRLSMLISASDVKGAQPVAYENDDIPDWILPLKTGNPMYKVSQKMYDKLGLDSAKPIHAEIVKKFLSSNSTTNFNTSLVTDGLPLVAIVSQKDENVKANQVCLSQAEVDEQTMTHKDFDNYLAKIKKSLEQSEKIVDE